METSAEGALVVLISNPTPLKYRGFLFKIRVPPIYRAEQDEYTRKS